MALAAEKMPQWLKAAQQSNSMMQELQSVIQSPLTQEWLDDFRVWEAGIDPFFEQMVTAAELLLQIDDGMLESSVPVADRMGLAEAKRLYTAAYKIFTPFEKSPFKSGDAVDPARYWESQLQSYPTETLLEAGMIEGQFTARFAEEYEKLSPMIDDSYAPSLVTTPREFGDLYEEVMADQRQLEQD